jgi:hypothetical protein
LLEDNRNETRILIMKLPWITRVCVRVRVFTCVDTIERLISFPSKLHIKVPNPTRPFFFVRLYNLAEEYFYSVCTLGAINRHQAVQGSTIKILKICAHKISRSAP